MAQNSGLGKGHQLGMSEQVESKTALERYFQNPYYTDFAQMTVAFAISVVSAIFSFGFLYFLAFIIAYEVVYAYFSGGKAPFWTPTQRLGVIAASITGYIVGRSLVGEPL